MGQAIGGSLALAVGVALSPIPIIAVVLPKWMAGIDNIRPLAACGLAALLGRLKDWMGEHNAVIMSVLCLVIGVKLIGDAISGLTS